MNKIREYIDTIVETGKPEDMNKLADILTEIICMTKEAYPDIYKKYKMKLYKMIHGEVLTKELAEDIVHEMKPYGEYWNFETTTNVKNQYGIQDISDVDFYIVMNKSYNDNKNTADTFIQENHRLDFYVSLTKDFILDVDAKEGKVFKYFTN